LRSLSAAASVSHVDTLVPCRAAACRTPSPTSGGIVTENLSTCAMHTIVSHTSVCYVSGSGQAALQSRDGVSEAGAFGYRFTGARRQRGLDFHREILISLVAGQFLQTVGDENDGSGNVAPAPRDLRPQERQIWPGQRRARGEPVQQALFGVPANRSSSISCHTARSPARWRRRWRVSSKVPHTFRGRARSARPAASSASR